MSVSIEDYEKVFLHAMFLMKDGDNGSGEICKTLKRNGITDIIGIFGMSKSEIEGLEYKENKQTFKLNRGQLSMICILSAYNTNHIWAGVPLKVLEWLNVTQEMFDDFRIIYNPVEYFGPVTNLSNTPSVTGISLSSSGRTTAHDPVREFKCSIKCDPQQWRQLSQEAKNTRNSLDINSKDIILCPNKSQQQQTNAIDFDTQGDIINNVEANAHSGDLHDISKHEIRLYRIFVLEQEGGFVLFEKGSLFLLYVYLI